MYRVLIADDEPFIVEGIKHIINWEEYGIELISTASNGIEALELLKKEGADLLITDIRMPKMNGLELIQKVKELKLNTRFIILSGYDDFEYLKESIKLGIENYLLKPINGEELEETIVNIRNKIEDRTLQKSYSRKDIDIIRNNILYRWVTDSINQNELVERASLLDIPLESSQYIVCILRLLPNTNTSMEQYTLTQKAEEICSKAIKSDNLGLVFCTPESNIIFIMSGLKDSSKLAEYCINNLKKAMNVNYFFTIGSIENDCNLVSRSYFKAMELQQYSIIMPCNSILDYSSFKQSILNDRIQEMISYNEICKYVSAKDLDSLISYIDATFSALMHTNGVTPTSAKNIAAELLFCIINSTRMVIEAKNSPMNELDSPFSNIYKMESLEDICEFIKATAKRLVNLSIEKNESINPSIKRILDYVKINYSSDLCLKTLAIDLKSNANYLGQLFKEETGEYFSDYVNMIRINKSKELLQNTSRSTKDISNDVGYKDVNYFYRAFKKYSGVSPSEFRSM